MDVDKTSEVLCSLAGYLKSKGSNSADVDKVLLRAAITCGQDIICKQELILVQALWLAGAYKNRSIYQLIIQYIQRKFSKGESFQILAGCMLTICRNNGWFTELQQVKYSKAVRPINLASIYRHLANSEQASSKLGDKKAASWVLEQIARMDRDSAEYLGNVDAACTCQHLLPEVLKMGLIGKANKVTIIRQLSRPEKLPALKQLTNYYPPNKWLKEEVHNFNTAINDWGSLEIINHIQPLIKLLIPFSKTNIDKITEALESSSIKRVEILSDIQKSHGALYRQLRYSKLAWYPEYASKLFSNWRPTKSELTRIFNELPDSPQFPNHLLITKVKLNHPNLNKYISKLPLEDILDNNFKEWIQLFDISKFDISQHRIWKAVNSTPALALIEQLLQLELPIPSLEQMSKDVQIAVQKYLREVSAKKAYKLQPESTHLISTEIQLI